MPYQRSWPPLHGPGGSASEEELQYRPKNRRPSHKSACLPMILLPAGSSNAARYGCASRWSTASLSSPSVDAITTLVQHGA